MVNVPELIWERSFLPDSHASRRGKGITRRNAVLPALFLAPCLEKHYWGHLGKSPRKHRLRWASGSSGA
jgi:hypothetical protein